MQKTLKAVHIANPTNPQFWYAGLGVFVISFLASPIGGALSVIAAASLVGLWLYLSARFGTKSNAVFLWVGGALLAYWALLALHPNVPDAYTGILGWRKSCLFVVALYIGFLWPRSIGKSAKALWFLLGVACVISIIIHQIFPSFERSLSRSAGLWTSTFGGEARMQGIFAGPFHASLAGSFLVLIALYGWSENRRIHSFYSLAIGSVVLVLSQVRTGYVAIAFGVLAYLLLALRGIRRFAFLGGIAILGLLLVLFAPVFNLDLNDWFGSGNAALASLAEADTDTRLLGRFDTWEQALLLIRESPIIGWGAGSAGDTLAPLFAGGEHVTSHNVGLKYLVEGGLVGAFLVVAVLMMLVAKVRSVNSTIRYALWPAVITLLVFGSTGAIVEAVPVSLLLAVFMGMAANPRSDVCLHKNVVGEQKRSFRTRDKSLGPKVQ